MKKYRKLKIGEKIKKGDEFLMSNKKWVKSCNWDNCEKYGYVGWGIKDKTQYRRPIVETESLKTILE